MGIGMFKDDPKRLSAAAAYLTKAISHTFSKVYVLTGAPGVGKSTLASKMADIFEVVEADKWTRDRHGMYDLIEKLAKQGGGKPVLVVQPFRSLTTIKLIEDRGITIKLVVLDIPAGEHLARLQSRRPSVTCLSDLVNKRRHRSRVYASNRSTVFCGDEARIEDYFRNTL
jgi:adenylate kinase family enzyme